MPHLTISGAPIYHETHGDGEPVLLLHGGFCSLEPMRELMGAVVAAGYRVAAPERPGHGRSPDREGPWSYDDGLADSLAYLDAVGLDSVHVVGFSDGADIGMLMALRQPDRVRSLIHISGNLFPDCYVPEELWARASPADALRLIEEEYTALTPDPPGQAAVIEAKLLAAWAAEPRIDPSALAAITMPTLVMAGEFDMIAPEHTQLIAAGIPGAELVIVPGASHLCVREEPASIAATITAFLARHPA